MTNVLIIFQFSILTPTVSMVLIAMVAMMPMPVLMFSLVSGRSLRMQPVVPVWIHRLARLVRLILVHEADPLASLSEVVGTGGRISPNRAWHHRFVLLVVVVASWRTMLMMITLLSTLWPMLLLLTTN
jgi:hypothetical protein